MTETTELRYWGQPSEKQTEFLKAEEKYVAFGGARGGGKSWAVRFKAKALCLRYPGIRVLIVRRTFKELQLNHIETMEAELAGIARYNRQEKVFRWPNGSTIWFGYCASDGDLVGYQGAEYDVIFLDEATNLREEWIRKLSACMRGANDFPKRTYFTCNPGGPGHGYVKRLFIDREYRAGEKPEDYRFIRSLVTDNPALLEKDPDYVRQLEALPPKLREAWLYGSWDVYEGQVFEEFRDDPEHYRDRRWTHVIEPFDLETGPARGWNIYRSYDHGFRKPFSVGWWAVDPDGVLYRILELYGCTETPDEGVRWPVERIMDRIAETERTHPWLKGKRIQGVADPAIWQEDGGPSVSETAARHGVLFTPGDHKRLPGWMQCHYRLAFDEDGRPMMYVFRGCRAFIRTIPLLCYDPYKAEDVDTSMEDHVADEWRYMCMARPVPPREPKQAKPVYIDPLDQLKKSRVW